MRRWLRLVLVAAAGLAVLVGGMVGAVHVALSRGALTAAVDAALEATIGRAVAHGAVSVRPGLRPRIALADAAIANIAGGSAPDFARIGRLEVTLAVLPLLSRRVEIHSLLLADADILLERDAAGHANWLFGGGGGASPSRGLSIAALEIADSRIRLPGAPVYRIEIASLTMARDEPDDPLELSGRVRLNGEALSIDARLGVDEGGALPLSATIRGEGLRVALSGAWPRGTEAPGWSLMLDAQAEPGAVARLARRFGGRDLPLVPGPVEVAARLGPGSPFPTISDVKVKVGAMDAGAILPGLRLTRAEFRAASFEQPVGVRAEGRRRGAPLALAMTLPPLRTMLEAPAEEAWPVEATVTSGASRLTLAGGVRPDRGVAATTFEARLVTPELARLGQALGVGLPRLTRVEASARLTGLGARELRLQALSVRSEAMDAEGELTVGIAARTRLGGRLAMRRLDLDRLGAAQPAQRGRTAPRLIPAVALPVETLRGIDAALTLSAATLRANGTDWRDASATVALANGRLALDPFVVTAPGGVLGGRLTIDAAGAVPVATLRLESRGRGLDLVALRRAFGVPAGFEGQAEIVLDLRGQGANLQALAATASGEAGIAMVGGRFKGASALSIGPDLARALFPRGTPQGGVGLRCVALRLSAEGGVAQSQVLLMEGEFGRIDGSLAVNLRTEALAARLLPDVRLMGLAVRTPVTVGGTLAAPRVGVEPGAALAQVVGDTVANRLWRSSTVEFLRGAAGGTPPGGDCASALPLARLGRAGRIPEPASVPIPLIPREVQGVAQDVVRGIGGLLGGLRR